MVQSCYSLSSYRLWTSLNFPVHISKEYPCHDAMMPKRRSFTSIDVWRLPSQTDQRMYNPAPWVPQCGSVPRGALVGLSFLLTPRPPVHTIYTVYNPSIIICEEHMMQHLTNCATWPRGVIARIITVLWGHITCNLFWRCVWRINCQW